MASTISAEVEIKSGADKFWGGLRDSTNIFPKAFPHDYKSIAVVEGDGKAPGSIRHFTYGEEVEIKSGADKFWGGLRDSTNIFPKAFPHDYKSIAVVEGDGKAPGSIRHFTYGEGSPIVKESWEKIEVVDEEKKFVTYAVVEGDLLKYYKPFKGTINVIPTPQGSLVKWSCVFDKATNEVPDPHVIKDFAVKNFLELDDLLIKA